MLDRYRSLRAQIYSQARYIADVSTSKPNNLQYYRKEIHFVFANFTFIVYLSWDFTYHSHVRSNATFAIFYECSYLNNNVALLSNVEIGCIRSSNTSVHINIARKQHKIATTTIQTRTLISGSYQTCTQLEMPLPNRVARVFQALPLPKLLLSLD